jgi:hypothetical protein
MPHLIQLVIFSRDRADYLKNTLDSALNQEYSEINYEIIISDNSEGDDVNKLINASYLNYKNIKYIKRNPPTSSHEHFEKVISEITSEYVVLFHDDDILHPHYFKKICPYILETANIAVGCNATIFKKNINDTNKKMHSFRSVIEFKNKKPFLEQYLLGNGGVAPFSGYIYKTLFLKKIFSNFSSLGKHSDVILLSSLLSYGPIVWLPDSLMYYRVHEGSDSAKESIPDRLKLLRFMYLEGVSKYSKPVFLYRFLFWINWVRQQGPIFENFQRGRYRIAIKFILFGSFRVLFSKYFINLILKNIKSFKL